MGQTSVIAGVTIIAFVIFITVKGELPIYLGFLTGDVNAQGGSGNTAANAGASTTSNAANTLLKAAPSLLGGGLPAMP